MKFRFITKYSSMVLKKRYLFYSAGYGVSTLIVPFTVQYMVNNLALSGIWLNIVSVMLIISVGLVLTQVLKFCQFILLEFIQRQIFKLETERWKDVVHQSSAAYFFEIPSLLKSFSKAFGDVVEMALVMIFGLLVLVSFHPFFFVLAMFIAGGVYAAFLNFGKAVESSIEESGAKYHIFYSIRDGKGVSVEDVMSYLTTRDQHFQHLKRNFYIVAGTFLISQILLLAVGVVLIQWSQLSIGQFVSAEIILTGILVSFGKLPKSLEAIYDYETSQYKLSYALEDSHG